MRRQTESDRFEFVPQPLHLVPVGDVGQRRCGQRGTGAAEQRHLPAVALSRDRLTEPQQRVGGFEQAMPIALERVERAGIDQAFQLPLGQRLGIDCGARLRTGL